MGPWALCVLCTSALCKRGGGCVNRLWAPLDAGGHLRHLVPAVHHGVGASAAVCPRQDVSRQLVATPGHGGGGCELMFIRRRDP